jgi:hypothetical protein
VGLGIPVEFPPRHWFSPSGYLQIGYGSCVPPQIMPQAWVSARADGPIAFGPCSCCAALFLPLTGQFVFDFCL